MATSVKKITDGSDKALKCKLYNKGMCRHDNVSEHTEKGILYQHYRTLGGVARPLLRISGRALHVGKLVVTCRCPVVYSAVYTGFLHL